MKRIGILSDTHGYLDDIDLVLEATADQEIDMWLHAGDYGDDARYMQEHTDIPAVSYTHLTVSLYFTKDIELGDKLSASFLNTSRRSIEHITL